MTMNLKAKYRDKRIRRYKLSTLTPMGLNRDERWRTRDLPSIVEHGLWYPIMIYCVTPKWWNNSFSKWRSDECIYQDPVVNKDGLIWAIKMGSNRYQCAKHLGYTSIDGIMFYNSDECVKLAAWFRDCDPLNNKNPRPYQGLFSYDDL